MKPTNSKSFILVLCFFLFGCATMSGPKASPEMRTFERIINLPGQSKNDLYIKANAWAVKHFGSAESVIEFSDKEAGRIMGNYIFTYDEGVYSYAVKQTLDIAIKEGKVKVEIQNPFYRVLASMGDPTANSPYRPLETVAGIKKLTRNGVN